MKLMAKKPFSKVVINVTISFLLFWAFWHLAIDGGNFQSVSSITSSGFHTLIVFGITILCIISAMHILKPALVEESRYDRLRLYKKHHMSLKLVALFAGGCAVFFTILRLFEPDFSILSVSIVQFAPLGDGNTNPFDPIFPFWMEPIVGFGIGLIPGLIAAGFTRWGIFNSESMGLDKGYFFRDKQTQE